MNNIFKKVLTTTAAIMIIFTFVFQKNYAQDIEAMQQSKEVLTPVSTAEVKDSHTLQNGTGMNSTKNGNGGESKKIEDSSQKSDNSSKTTLEKDKEHESELEKSNEISADKEEKNKTLKSEDEKETKKEKITISRDVTKTSVKLSKTEKNKAGEMEGVKLALVRGSEENGSEVARWTSTSKPHELQLEPGTYTMIEVEAPEGFKKANPITFTVKDNKINFDSKYVGYNDLDEYKSEGINEAIYVKQRGSYDVGTIVYCFNSTKHVPPHKSSRLLLEYVKQFGSGQLFTEKAQKPKLKDEALTNAVLKVIHNGYPNDASGLKKKYGLTEGQFRKITQNAVWYYTDSIDRTVYYNGKENEKMAYKELVGESLVKAPTNMVLNIYSPVNTTGTEERFYQNLLSTRFIEPMMVNMENERINPFTPINKPKKDTPKNNKPKEEPKEEAKKEELKKEAKKEEPKEEPKKKEPKKEEPKKKEAKKEEPKEEPKKKEPKEEEPKEEPKKKEPKEEPKKKEPKEEPKSEESKKNEPIRETTRRHKSEKEKKEENPTKEDDKVVEKNDEPKNEEPRHEEEFSGEEKKEDEEEANRDDNEKIVTTKEKDPSTRNNIKKTGKILPATGEGLSFGMYALISALAISGIVYFGIKSGKSEEK